jgi:hypothetical protein
MSLAVPDDLLEKAHRGEADDAAFPDCVRAGRHRVARGVHLRAAAASQPAARLVDG